MGGEGRGKGQGGRKREEREKTIAGVRYMAGWLKAFAAKTRPHFSQEGPPRNGTVKPTARDDDL